MSIARKILDNQRLSDRERAELAHNLPAVVAEMRAIWMAERGWERRDTSAPSPTEGYGITRSPTTVSGLENLK